MSCFDQNVRSFETCFKEKAKVKGKVKGKQGNQKLNELIIYNKTKSGVNNVNLNENNSNISVFLGGSCNPTSWRTDIAIPMLTKFGITYYNPQVANWRPELMELESCAKQNAKVLLFVIDNQTRSVASMIEAAYIAGSKKRNLILVIQEFSGPGSIIDDEHISEKEYKVLQQGQKYLQFIVNRQAIPVCDQITRALTCVARAIRDGLCPRDISQKIAIDQKINHEFIRLDSQSRDIYLGGSEYPASNWREEIAIPLLKQRGLTYFAPQSSAYKIKMIPFETAAIEKSKVILFVITKNTRALACMIAAGHYVSKNVNNGHKVVLCIQHLDEDCTIENEKLTKSAIKDYNRGRVYLSDLAIRAGTPVYENIGEAVMCCIRICMQN